MLYTLAEVVHVICLCDIWGRALGFSTRLSAATIPPDLVALAVRMSREARHFLASTRRKLCHAWVIETRKNADLNMALDT